MEDRVAQTVVKEVLEPELEKHFHPDSYGYRPGKSAHQALGQARERCWRSDWVLDLDIRSFFDTLDHDLLLRAVRHHTDEKWVVLYIERWLKAPAMLPDGEVEERDRGTPQGGVASPLLANLFLHYVFDSWMERHYPTIRFERYADDIVCHCRSERQAHHLQGALTRRFVECGLELHREKTKIVYCQDSDRRVPRNILRLSGLHVPAPAVEEQVGRILREFQPGDQQQGGESDSAGNQELEPASTQRQEPR